MTTSVSVWACVNPNETRTLERRAPNRVNLIRTASGLNNSYRRHRQTDGPTRSGCRGDLRPDHSQLLSISRAHISAGGYANLCADSRTHLGPCGAPERPHRAGAARIVHTVRRNRGRIAQADRAAVPAGARRPANIFLRAGDSRTISHRLIGGTFHRRLASIGGEPVSRRAPQRTGGARAFKRAHPPPPSGAPPRV